MLTSTSHSTMVNNVLRNFNSAVNENAAVFSEKSRPLYITELVDKFTKESIDRIKNDGKAVRPWNRDDLLKRLKTFSPSSWFAKPDIISPIKCASSGWTNSGLDTLICWNCKSTLKHIFDDISGENLSNSLHTQHSSSCGWNNNICDENLIYLPWNSKEGYITCYRKRFNDLRCLKNSEVIEYIEIIFPKSILNFYYLPEHPNLAQTSDEQIYQKLIDTLTFFLVNLSLDKYVENRQYFHYSKLETSISILALFGWSTPHPCTTTTTSTSTTTDVSMATSLDTTSHAIWIECQYCSRKIDLRYYLPHDLNNIDSSTTTTATMSTTTPSNNTMRQTRPFHPIDQHHYWCPWSQLNLGDALHHNSSSLLTSATITNTFTTPAICIPGIIRFLAAVKTKGDSNNHSIEAIDNDIFSNTCPPATHTPSAISLLGVKRNFIAASNDNNHDDSVNSISDNIDQIWLEDAYKRIRLALDLVVTKTKFSSRPSHHK